MPSIGPAYSASDLRRDLRRRPSNAAHPSFSAGLRFGSDASSGHAPSQAERSSRQPAPPRPPGPNRKPDRHLPRPRRPRHQQARSIRAADRQHERDCPEDQRHRYAPIEGAISRTPRESAIVCRPRHSTRTTVSAVFTRRMSQVQSGHRGERNGSSFQSPHPRTGALNSGASRRRRYPPDPAR